MGEKREGLHGDEARCSGYEDEISFANGWHFGYWFF